MTGLEMQVKKYALENGVTIQAVCDAIGVCRTSLYMKLNGDTEFRLGEAARLAEVLGISIDELYALMKK